MSGKLKNKVTIITGGSSRIGLAIAKLFAAQGAKDQVPARPAFQRCNNNISITSTDHKKLDLYRLKPQK